LFWWGIFQSINIVFLYPNKDVWRASGYCYFCLSPVALLDAAIGLAILLLRMRCEHKSCCTCGYSSPVFSRQIWACFVCHHSEF